MGTTPVQQAGPLPSSQGKRSTCYDRLDEWHPTRPCISLPGRLIWPALITHPYLPSQKKKKKIPNGALSLSLSRVSPADLGSFFCLFLILLTLLLSLSLSLYAFPHKQQLIFKVHVPYKLWVLLPIYSSPFSFSVSYFILSNKYKNICNIINTIFYIITLK